MANVTLADIRTAADRKYGPFVVDLGGGVQATLLNILRLSKEKRAEFTAQQKRLEAAQEAADQDLEQITGALRDLLRVLAESYADADRLLSALGDDNAVLMELWESYNEAATPGEALPSGS
jgi:hypothetical protein